MKFVMHRNRTIVSLSGHAIEFVKGELTHVPPAMYEQVMAAGGVPETELDLDPPAEGQVEEPTDPTTRQRALFKAMEKVTLRGKREEFTASGAPHAKVLSNELGWIVGNKERDAVWTAFQTRENE
jgi:hypothetical protein